uniref:Uncharacterized protein n=1 Tax=Rhizophora mucronata TaxID=61149 RepID=A0A2P2NUL7_RHIMU
MQQQGKARTSGSCNQRESALPNNLPRTPIQHKEPGEKLLLLE